MQLLKMCRAYQDGVASKQNIMKICVFLSIRLLFCPILQTCGDTSLANNLTENEAISDYLGNKDEHYQLDLEGSRGIQFNKIGNKLPACACGVKARHNVKIVGGVLSKKHSWPWVAAIVYVTSSNEKKPICGSSVIGKQHLLTAAHCIDYILEAGISNFQIILGTNDLNDSDAVVRNITLAYAHPKFNETSLDYDVGIIEMDNSVQYSQAILPICLTPQGGVPYTNKTAVVAGWGSTYFGGATTTMQMQVMLGVISNAKCQSLYKNETKITMRMMCASRSNKDSCQGDSGGPLFLLQDGSNDHYLQIGIVSFGKGCGDKRYPGIYSRVSRFTKWIRQRVGNDAGCNFII